jgi:choline dehydrogenase-like flavoprotein
MICAGEALADGGTTEAEVAIVGAGAIGVALAVRLAGRVGRIVLIEAGGARFKSANQLSFFRAQQIDDSRHAPGELYRRRMLGGTTSVWGGRCIPFDLEDFAPACGRAGWPIAFTDFYAHVPDALAFLDAGVPEFSAAVALPKHPLPLKDPISDLVVNSIERYSKPTDVWRKWRYEFARSREVTVIHGTTCTGVLTNLEGTCVAALQLKTVSNRRHTVSAATIVLACGGLETPRLLLASRGSRSCGLGNERDFVGRFYMTHLVSSAANVGALSFTNPDCAHAFNFNKTADGVYGRRMILLSPEARRRESLPNIVFRPSRPPMDDASQQDPVLSTAFLVRRLLIPPEYARSMATRLGSLPASHEWREHGRNIVCGIPYLMRFGVNWLMRRTLAARKLPSIFLYRKDGRYPLEFNAEHLPNADSRVLLGSNTDPLGMPRLMVQWRFRDTELDSICRAYHVLAAAIAKSGLGEVQLDPDLLDSVQRALVPQGGHHIGTTRMSADGSTGVVDKNGEVWGVRGLFVAGTAVFPSSGFANPTLTAVALAFRLAEYLVERHATAKPSVINCDLSSPDKK